MPTKSLLLTEIIPSRLVWDKTKVDLHRFAFLLPTDENGSVSFFGKYRNSSTIEFPNFVAKGITQLWSVEIEAGFKEDSSGNQLGNVKLQLSNDNGVTYLYWTGSAWGTAGANDWSGEADIQNNIATFPFVAGSQKQIRIKAQLSPDTAESETPYLYGIHIHFELDFVPEEDVIRSLFAKIENELRIKTESALVLGQASSSFKPNVTPEITSVIGVYNITTDPGRLANIFGSLTKTVIQTLDTGEVLYDQTITMTAPQPTNSEIVTRMFLKVYPYIAPDADYVLGEMPKFVIEVGDHSEDMEFRNDSNKVEKNIAKMKARIRKHATAYRMPITILSYSPDDLLTKEMNRALIRLINNKFILSLWTGMDLLVLDEDEFKNANVIREDLSIKKYSFTLLYHDWDSEYEEVPLADIVQVIVDDGG